MDVSDTFYFFSALGLGEREEASEEVARGGPDLRKIEGGGVPRRRRGKGKGAGGMSVGRGGGGLNIFFSGPKCPPSPFLEGEKCHKSK